MNILLWILQIGVAAMFLVAGGSKLAGAPAMVAMFDTLGMGRWFLYVTGALEVTSAVLLLIPGCARWGAALGIAIMCGAIIACLLFLHISPFPALAMLIASSFILWRCASRSISRGGS